MTVCKMCHFEKTFDAENAAELKAGLMRGVLTYEDIAFILTDEGHPISGKSVSRHVRSRH